MWLIVAVALSGAIIIVLIIIIVVIVTRKNTDTKPQASQSENINFNVSDLNTAKNITEYIVYRLDVIQKILLRTKMIMRCTIQQFQQFHLEHKVCKSQLGQHRFYNVHIV